ncbi:MAG: flagellar hook-length control protein FliK [Phycisphaerales bacterium]|nr:flagellar hook-length control protein FliK [Phycisphaerales bacterium]
MIQMEGLAARPVTPSGRTEPNDVRAYLGVFDSVFQNMRQSTSRLADLAEEKARQKMEDRSDSQTEAAAERAAERSEKRSRIAAEDPASTRLDRLREQAAESPRTTEETGRRNQAKSDRVRQNPNAEANNEDSNNSTDQAGGDDAIIAVLPAPLFMNGAPLLDFNMHGAGNLATDGEAVKQTTDGTVTTNATSSWASQLSPSVAASESAFASAGLHGGAGWSAEQSVASPNAGQSGSEGRQGGSAHSSTTAAVKGGDAAAQTRGTAMDFQGVFEGAARTSTDSSLKNVKTVPSQQQSSAASGTIDLNRPGSIRELAHILRGRAGLHNSNMTLRLDPPELGQVRIEVRMQQQELSLRIQADTEAGHDALHSKLGDLRDALERQGIQIKEMDVEWRPPASTPAAPRDADGQAPQDGPHDGSAFDRSGGQPDESRHHSEAASGGGTGNYEPGVLVEKEEYDWVAGLAETGVDLIV